MRDSNVADCNGDGVGNDFDGDLDEGIGGGFFGFGPWADEPACSYGLRTHGGNVVVNDVVFGSAIAFVVGADDTSGPVITPVTDPTTGQPTGEFTCSTDGSITPGDPATNPTADADDCLTDVFVGSGSTCGAGGDGGYWVLLRSASVSESPGGIGIGNAPTLGTITATGGLMSSGGRSGPCVDATGIGPPCAASEADGPPARPSLVAVGGDGETTLSWSVPHEGGSPVTGFTVYRGTCLGCEAPIASPPPAPRHPNLRQAGQTYTDTGLENGKTYYYYVTATNAAGTSPSSNPAFGFTRGQNQMAMIGEVMIHWRLGWTDAQVYPRQAGWDCDVLTNNPLQVVQVACEPAAGFDWICQNFRVSVAVEGRESSGTSVIGSNMCEGGYYASCTAYAATSPPGTCVDAPFGSGTPVLICTARIPFYNPGDISWYVVECFNDP